MRAARTFLLVLTVSTVVVAFSSPAGVKSTLDASQIEQLRKVGADLTKPMMVNFGMHVTTHDAADRVAAKLNDLGLMDVKVEPPSRGKLWIIRARKTMLLKEADLVSLRRQLDNLLAPEIGGYDGWGASWAPPPH